jgi:hypothetical protein
MAQTGIHHHHHHHGRVHRYPKGPVFSNMTPDYLCRQAESMIRTLSDGKSAGSDAALGSHEPIVDGYAHVLALDVDRLRLEREIARLAESGDPRMAGELRELSVMLRRVTHTSEQLRGLLDAARARAELAGRSHA